MPHSNFPNAGMMPRKTRHDNPLIAVSPSRSLFGNTLAPLQGMMVLPTPGSVPPFVDQTQAIQAMEEGETVLGQSGEGVLDIAKAGLRLASKAFPSSLGKVAQKVLGTAAKVSGALATAQAVGAVARGPIGTKISNVLSEKFNKNPNWRPGFSGEAHLVLPTQFGLTRANFCGPGTNLQKRLPRGDKGVSEIDSACQIHDMLYTIAKSAKDIRAADDRLISDIRKAKSAGAVQKQILIKGIQAKKLGENIGVFGPETFTTLPGLQGRGFGTFGRSALLGSSGLARAGLAGRGFQTKFVPNLISQDNLTRLARRLAGHPGSVRRPDPTISGLTSLGAGHTTEAVLRKAIDPTIRGMTSGSGFAEAAARAALQTAVLRPGELLRADVLKKLRKRGKRLRGGRRGRADPPLPLGQLLSSTISQRTSIRPQPGSGFLSGLLGIVPSIVRAFKGKGLVPAGQGSGLIKDILRLLKKTKAGRELKRLGKKAQITAKQVAKLVSGAIGSQRGRGLLLAGQGQSGGIFGALASLAASIIVPAIIKKIRGRKKKKKRRKGRGLAPAGAGLKLAGQGFFGKVFNFAKKVVGKFVGGRLVTAQQGNGLAKEVARLVLRNKKLRGFFQKFKGKTPSKLISLITSRVLKSQRGSGLLLAGQGQKGGIFGALASLAASIIIPEVIRKIRGRKKKRGRKKRKGRGLSPAGAGIGSVLAKLAASIAAPELIKLVRRRRRK